MLNIKWIFSAHLLLFFLSFPVFSDTYNGHNSKWNDINIGGSFNASEDLPYFPSRINSDDHRDLAKENFQKPEVCGSCHTDIYQQWKESMMAKSWDDPIYRALLKRTSEVTDGKLDYFCTGCHTPIGMTTGQITSQGNQQDLSAESTDPLPGVDCESCHNISKRIGLDNGGFHIGFDVEDRPVKYGPRSDSVSPFHDTQYSELHTRSDFCAACHNVTHPFNNVPIERTYDEWLESAYAIENIGCQDCHMSSYRGKAAIMGPERDDIASHAFPGGNTTILKHLGLQEGAEAGRKMLKTAAKIEILPNSQGIKKGEINIFSVKVSNTGAGHKLPTGFPEGREIWIDFTVKDGRGDIIYRLGAISDGKTEAGTKNFKVHLGNAQGKEVEIEVWDVTHIISDNRILPRGYSIEEFYVAIAPDSIGPFNISAKLNYWPFSQALADELVGEDIIAVDIVEMVKHDITMD